MVCLHPESSECSSQKYLYIFILSFFVVFFCLLKIVLQVLASVDIKITVMCKTLKTTQLTRIRAGCPIRTLSILRNFFPFHFFPKKHKKQTNEKPKTFAVLGTPARGPRGLGSPARAVGGGRRPRDGFRRRDILKQRLSSRQLRTLDSAGVAAGGGFPGVFSWLTGNWPFF